MTFRVRAAVAVSVGAFLAVLAAQPASAHVEVEADKTQAGATDVTLTFHGEAESGSAGIRSERVVLPAGVAPTGVRLVKAPKGWKFTAAADGFTVAGPALKIGQDAEFAVRLAQLPSDATSVSFKTLETYGDGEIARWIEIPEAGQPEPDHPAPTIKLKAAAKPATTSASPAAPVDDRPPSVSPAPSFPAPSLAAIDQATPADSDKSGVVWGITIAIAVIVVAAGWLIWRRRSSAAR